jgi:hydroxymethylpyrimidine/phosphomethylpyrimidine kinase
MRSAATIRFSEKALAVFRAMFLECIPVSSHQKPPAITSMDWGVAACCNGGVPDIIYDSGGNEKPGYMHIFGEDPVVVANNIIICSNRI